MSYSVTEGKISILQSDLILWAGAITGENSNNVSMVKLYSDHTVLIEFKHEQKSINIELVDFIQFIEQELNLPLAEKRYGIPCLYEGNLYVPFIATDDDAIDIEKTVKFREFIKDWDDFFNSSQELKFINLLKV